MKRLVLHIGPGKCGSTSIQIFLSKLVGSSNGKIYYQMLRPDIIVGLNQPTPQAESRKEISNLLSAISGKGVFLILSHEYLASCPRAVLELTTLALEYDFATIIAGFCRKQADFLVSAYSQWLFRDHSTVSLNTASLIAADINPIYFSGLEQQLIASILDDFASPQWSSLAYVMNWKNSYGHLRSITSEHGAEVKCCLLPDGRSGATSILAEFCTMVDLASCEGINQKAMDLMNANPVANSKFNHEIVELISLATSLGLPMPNVHEANDTINRLGSLAEQISTTPASQSPFISRLKDYIASHFFADNLEFCHSFGILEAYFYVDEYLCKHQIIEDIQQEAERRQAEPEKLIIENRRLASLAMALAITM